ncbi:MAG: hypothetical protein L0Z55_11410 [Planctomycetes bacterium]|nr:hypothetical protein [Planctomycetota bacterium]
MLPIATKDVVAGAVLASPVLDGDGRILLRAGTVLTAGILERLQAWSIQVVTLRGKDGESRDDVAAAEPGVSRLLARTIPLETIFPAGHGSREAAIIVRAFAAWQQTYKGAKQTEERKP